MKMRMNGTTAPRLLGLMVILLTAGSAGAQEFGYAGENGPPIWDQLSPDWTTCGEGEIQSPIVIIDSLAKRGQSSPLLFNYGIVAVQAVHTGHSVQANISSGVPSVTIGGDVYELTQFHLHTPSEHWLNGNSFPMEMHLVHKDSNGMLAVLGVFLKSGEKHEELDKILGAGNLPLIEGDTTDIGQFDLTDLLPGQLQTFRYEGSLTTPPCSEGVKWFVFTEPMTVSPQQILDYQGIFSGEEFPEGNARPVRQTGSRDVSLSRPQWK